MTKHERLHWHASWLIEKYAANELVPYEIIHIDGNCALHAGINLLFQLATGDSSAHFTSASAQIGVGDDDTTASGAQTGLQSISNTYYANMESGYPIAGEFQRVDFRSAFTGSVANFAWKELCVRNQSGGTCLNRLVIDLGTKRTGQTWIVRLRIELS
jgi:hypothetical protein